jgi:hypothetical protein
MRDWCDNEDAGDLSMMGAADASGFTVKFECMECGALHTLEEAEAIVFGSDRCECGGCDIDVA